MYMRLFLLLFLINFSLNAQKANFKAAEKFSQKNLNKMLGEMKFIHTQISNKIEDVNLKAIDNIRSITGKDVAFGHHCLDERVLYLSAVFEPSDIFFYVKST